jgi:acetyltransferase-like isoleucine patch superfamily enzyme
MLKLLWRLLITHTYWRFRLGAVGWRTNLFSPMLVTGASRIFIGSRSQIRDFARLEVINRPKLGWVATLRIGNRVNIEQGVHIVCQCEVTIEDDVSITPYCAIVDTYHPHDPPDQGPKIGNRLPTERSHVHIGAGTFVGMKTVILPNVRIGKGCVIGAGSVVDKDIPDYAMAAGSPVRIVSVFDPTTRRWS